MGNSCQLLQPLEQVILKFTTLIMMKLLWVPKTRDEVLEYLFRRCFPRFVPRWVRLSETREMVDNDEDVLKSSLAGLQM